MTEPIGYVVLEMGYEEDGSPITYANDLVYTSRATAEESAIRYRRNRDVGYDPDEDDGPDIADTYDFKVAVGEIRLLEDFQ